MQPAEHAHEFLPACTIALITAITLVSGGLEALLEAARTCREVVLLGPSTPVLSEAFVRTPVTWLSGIRLTHPTEVLRVVSEGGGTRESSPFSRKVNIRIARGGSASAP